MSKGIILDLCGGTGSWSESYRKAGYDVRLITLPEHDVRFYAIGERDLTFIGQNGADNEVIDMNEVVGILAAPPCTMFSIARRTAKIPPDFESAMEIVNYCFQIIWKIRGYQLQPRLKFWALENPTGLLRQFIGKPPFTFQQWQFGDGIVKRTDLWGYFNEPKPTVKVKPTMRLDKRWSSVKVKPKYTHLDRAARRAITPKGFANAFYKANSTP